MKHNVVQTYEKKEKRLFFYEFNISFAFIFRK